jgi:hypothetical protein
VPRKGLRDGLVTNVSVELALRRGQRVACDLRVEVLIQAAHTVCLYLEIKLRYCAESTEIDTQCFPS